jgi:hypothetical protein
MTYSSPRAFLQINRPFGLNVVLAYFVTYICLISFRLLVDLDFHLYRLIVQPYRVAELGFGLLSVLVVVGLKRMREWGRVLAIILAGVNAVSVIWFYVTVLFFGAWTLVPHQLWPNVKVLLTLGLGVYVVWYLSQPIIRRAFRHLNTLQPTVTDESESACD